MFAYESRKYPLQMNNCHVFTSKQSGIDYKTFISSITEADPFNPTPPKEGNVFVIYSVMKKQYHPLHSGVIIDCEGNGLSKYGEGEIKTEPVADTLAFYASMANTKGQSRVVVACFSPAELV